MERGRHSGFVQPERRSPRGEGMANYLVVLFVVAAALLPPLLAAASAVKTVLQSFISALGS